MKQESSFTFIILLTIFISIGQTSCSILKNREKKIVMETNYGNITVKLYNETPLHRDNFLKLTKQKFYDGVLFHRVIENFMIQGGDPTSKLTTPPDTIGNGDTGYTIPAEFRLPKIYHKRGVLAAAREGDDVNPKQASSGCQFYIVEGHKFTDKDLDIMQNKNFEKRKKILINNILKKEKLQINKLKKQKNISKLSLLNDSIIDVVNKIMVADYSSYIFTPQQRIIYKTIGGTPHLDGAYTIFGEVIDGMGVVDEISKVKTDKLDRPIIDVRIIKMRKIGWW